MSKAIYYLCILQILIGGATLCAALYGHASHPHLASFFALLSIYFGAKDLRVISKYE
jgi:hypothetical protein